MESLFNFRRAFSRILFDVVKTKTKNTDTSIWLYQFIKAMRTESGEMLPNAHLIGMFRRIAKLLFWRVRPVFVFDGDAPHLKKQTTARRRSAKSKSSSDAAQAAHKLLQTRLKLAALANSEVDANDASRASDIDSNSVPTIEISDDSGVIEPAIVSVSDDDDDDDEQFAQDFDDYDDTEAQEMLAAYGRMMNNDLPDIDPAVLESLDERVQLDFLFGVRELYRQHNKQKIRQMAFDQGQSIAQVKFICCTCYLCVCY
jgi:hypothetical protein